ncbi:MAG: DegT/DnrJ/EryC1/StrS family aminotransferase [Alphaproteobacteria bacterium]|nr:DegT/DnrJ/EryC1/StrS family aminotransferase [Alphaproteobacteria bacterium]MCB9695769.1 DegT/DnrJ/EryC1/StrS family aminotransferase [Alphaproteobacteria bacterium]
MIPVTKPFFPPIEDYDAQLREVWANGWLTNQGPKVRQLEAELTARCAASTALMANGTLALQLGIRALGFRRRVATTPFSFVATTSALVWEGVEPVFVDVDPETLNLDPRRLAELDADGVDGVLATHVYGVPCDIDAIGATCADRGWRVLYDGAHAFGTTWRGVPVLGLGDATATSFHATKLFHTGEGGAVFTRDPEVLQRLVRLRSFGEREKGEYVEAGINAKVSELHAAMGLAVLPHMEAVLERRRAQSLRYRERLAGDFQMQKVPDVCGYNHAYVPILLPDESRLLRVVERLAAQDIHVRRYFWPSLSQLPWVKQTPTPVADDAARRVACLPVYHDLTLEQVDRICDLVLEHGR